jgi:hypothetical protein
MKRNRFKNLEHCIKNVRMHFIQNVDEFDSIAWGDQKKVKRVILHQARLRSVKCPVFCKEKRISCIAPISMPRGVYLPLLVIHLSTLGAAVWEEC